jgi:hypothetical protein
MRGARERHDLRPSMLALAPHQLRGARGAAAGFANNTGK